MQKLNWEGSVKKEQNQELIIGVGGCLAQQINRVYEIEEYMKKINHLGKLNSQISITSVIIVGFPDETQNDYQETIDMMEKIRFDSFFSF